MSTWKVTVTKLRGRHGALRTDFGARILAAHMTKYAQCTLEEQDRIAAQILMDAFAKEYPAKGCA